MVSSRWVEAQDYWAFPQPFYRSNPQFVHPQTCWRTFAEPVTLPIQWRSWPGGESSRSVAQAWAILLWVAGCRRIDPVLLQTAKPLGRKNFQGAHAAMQSNPAGRARATSIVFEGRFGSEEQVFNNGLLKLLHLEIIEQYLSIF